ncbi:hypothetical protein IG631_05453 [Alternaria alternata]|nr:hypothetical protein IG631_05453 [Alternaria alternata]
MSAVEAMFAMVASVYRIAEAVSSVCTSGCQWNPLQLKHGACFPKLRRGSASAHPSKRRNAPFLLFGRFGKLTYASTQYVYGYSER